MSRRIKAFLALHAADRRLLARVAALVPMLVLALRVLGVGRCYGVLARRVPRLQPPREQPHGEVARVARIVRWAVRRGPVPASCLAESLLLWWLLRRRGISCELRIGVRGEGDGIDAHAWVELDGGTPVSDDNPRFRFRPFDGLQATLAPGQGEP